MPTARPAASAPPSGRSSPLVVELRDVSKQFQGARRVTALDPVNLAIPRGHDHVDRMAAEAH